MDKHRMCECCRTNFLLKDMKGDLCIVCYDFIQTRQNDKIADLEAKLAESERQLNYTLTLLNRECDACKPNQIAIEELEKVKKLLDDCYGYEYTSLYHFIQSKAEEKIDQQIKKLKGEK